MYEGQVGEIEQVVRDKLIVGLIMNVATRNGPRGIIIPVNVDNKRGISPADVARPYPENSVLFDQRIGAYAHLRWDFFLSRNFDAESISPEFDAMVSTADPIDLHIAERERSKPMAASILQRHAVPG